jgi:tetratricopeptide (TPR) repeat protein
MAGALLGWEGRISRAERQRAHRSRPSSLVAYERYLLAYEAETQLTRSSTQRAIELAEAALEVDPTLARAWLVRAYALTHAVLFGWAENREAAMRSYRESVLRAYELDPLDGTILIEVGDLRAHAGDIQGAHAAYEEAGRLATNHGDTLALLAKYVVGTLGRPDEGRAMMERAFRLNPGAPPLYFYNQLRVAYLLGDFQHAVSVARQSPATALAKSYLAMSLAQLGRDEESAQVARALCREHPEFDPASICDVGYLLDPRARRAVKDGLRKIERYLIPD